MNMIKLAISGCKGKMGQRICRLAEANNEFKIIVLLESKDHSDIGQKISGVEITSNLDSIRDADVLIDFTAPEATEDNLNICVKYSKPIIIGTTGLSDSQKLSIEAASEKIPVVFSPNMSVGVNLLFKLVKEAVNKLSKDYRVKIREAHHKHKKDSPSGTAKKLAEIIEEAQGEKVEDIESIREGELAGDHDVIFDSEYDTIKLSHSAKTRDIFAQGALTAAKWIIGQKRGLFSMQDII